MWTPDYYVYCTGELPDKVYGATLPNDDGSFSIYLNSNYPEEFQQRVFKHELRHVYEDHFYQERKSVAVMEAEANGARPIEPPPSDYPQNWLFDPWGMPLGRISPHPEGTKVIPLYNDPNDILTPWIRAGATDLIFAWTEIKGVGHK